MYSDEDVASARADLGPLWPLLRPGLWHSTPRTRYHAILDDGEIRPDGGQEGNVYKGSLAVSMDAVSLFDFENASEQDFLGTFKRWWSSYLYPSDPDIRLTVWIRLNRDLLPGRLMLANEVRELATRRRENFYPRVEACHVGPVPANAFIDALAVSRCEHERLQIGPATLARLDELAERCPPDDDEADAAQLVRILHAGCARVARGD